MLRFLVSPTLALVLAGAAASAPTRISATIVVHSFQTARGAQLIAWRPRPTAIAVALQADPRDGLIVENDTVTLWSEGLPTERIRYHFGGIEEHLRVRLGSSLEELERGVQADQTLTIESPLVSTVPAPMKMFTTVDDFGTHVAALAKAAPFPFRYPGRSTLGLRLARAHIVNSTDGRGKEWLGLAVGITYSSKPEALGTGDREFALTWATTHSAFGSDYYVELKKQHPVIRAGGIVAKLLESGDLVFRVGKAYCLAAPPRGLTVGEWRTFLRSLKPPI